MSSNGQINQQQQPQNAALPFSGLVDPAGLDGGMGMNGPVLVGVPAQQGPTLSGHTAQMLSVDAENISMRSDGLSLMQAPYGDGQGIPLTRPRSLSPDMQGQGTASSIVPPSMLPTFGFAAQTAGNAHTHGQPGLLPFVWPPFRRPPDNATLPDGSPLSQAAAMLAIQANISNVEAQQLMDAAMSQERRSTQHSTCSSSSTKNDHQSSRRPLSENQQLMATLARVCPECSTAVILLFLEVSEESRRKVIELEDRQVSTQRQVAKLEMEIFKLETKLEKMEDGNSEY